jgi:predicted PurR-regulated permease PerM
VVLLIYFLVSGYAIADGTFWLVPPEYRKEVRSVASKIFPILWRYFLGLAIVVTYTSTVAWIGFSLIFHLPRALLLAVAVGTLELVPLIGPAASIALVVLTAIQNAGMWAILAMVGFAAALRISIDQFVGPLVLGKAVRLHPVVIIFCFLSGAMLFGPIGLLLAVPVAAAIRIILTIYYAETVAEESSAHVG